MHIFGYGSLIHPFGINGRGMRYWYKDKDLTEATLVGYTRNWNAHIIGVKGDYFTSFLGIQQSNNPLTRINGVVFEINLWDLPQFLASEGFMLDNPAYEFRKVNVAGFKDVYTCVLQSTLPSVKNSVVSSQYLNKVKDYLKLRGKDFSKEFHKTTVHTDQTRKFFKL